MLDKETLNFIDREEKNKDFIFQVSEKLWEAWEGIHDELFPAGVEHLRGKVSADTFFMVWGLFVYKNIKNLKRANPRADNDKLLLGFIKVLNYIDEMMKLKK